MLKFVEYHYIDSINDLYNVCWSGAIERLDEICENDLEDEFMDYLEENFFIDGDYTTTELNDFIWFDCDDWIEEHKGDND